MKKSLFILLGCATMMMACNKNIETPVQSQVVDQSERVMLSMSLSSPVLSKATIASEANEANVTRAEVFVFRQVKDSDAGLPESWVLDGYTRNGGDGYPVISSAEGTINVTVSCTKGKRKIYAVLNADEGNSTLENALARVANEKQLLEAMSYLKYNIKAGALNNFVMIGKYTANEGIYDIQSASAVAMDVHRVASRVWLKKITKKFNTPGLQSKNFQIDRIYLTNVVNTINLFNEYNYSGTGVDMYVPAAETDCWYNKMMYQDLNATDKDPFLLREKWTLSDADESNNKVATRSDEGVAAVVPGEVEGVSTIKPGSVSFPVEGALYAYPNPTESRFENGIYIGDEAGEWSIRPTRLVIETTLDGTKYYYPITLPALESNKTYEIENLVITRPGSDDPDIPVVVYDVPFKISILGWEQVLLGNEGTITI